MLKAAVYSLSMLLLLGLTSCASLRGSPKVQLDDFSSSDLYSHSVPGTPAQACEASRRILLGQGYILDEEQPTSIRGHKNFQPSMDHHVQVRFNITCAQNSKGSNTATIFANAIKDRYSLRKSSNAASVGIGVLGSFSLPVTSSDDAMVKVGSETISAGKFYRQLFDAIERYMDASYKPDAQEANDQDENTEPASS